MSGSGSRGWAPTPPSSPCGNISFRAVINSPQPAVIAILQPGAILQVKHQTLPTNAVIVEYAGQLVGALTGTKINQLINCLLDGFSFEAEVVEVRGGTCIVDVRSA